MSKNSPTQRSLAKLRAEGWTCQITERWNVFARKRQDLFGFCDVLCIGRGGIMAVQTTTFGNMKARIAKIAAEPRALEFLNAGGLIQVHGWKKCGKRGITPGRWICETVNYPQI